MIAWPIGLLPVIDGAFLTFGLAFALSLGATIALEKPEGGLRG